MASPQFGIFIFRYPYRSLQPDRRPVGFINSTQGMRMMDELTTIDKTLDEVLVNLGAMVLSLADPSVTRTVQERRALAQSVNQYSICANRSDDPRVHQLRIELEEAIRPKLRLVSGG
jgi:hypothetical protein